MSVPIGAIEGIIRLKDEFSATFAKFDTRIAEIEAKVKKSSAPIKDETQKITESYKRLTAQLDPLVAQQHKYENAVKTLDSALKSGIITQDKYNNHVAQAKKKFLDAENATQSWRDVIHGLTGKISSLSGVLGPVSQQAAQNLESIASKGTEAASALAAFGPAIPFIIAAGVALAGLGAAWASISFVVESVKQGMEVQEIVEQLNASLRSNGAAAGYSAAQLGELADSLVVLSGREDEEILKAETIFTRFNKIGHEAFPLATKAALDLAQATGKSLTESFTIVGKALNEPSKGLTALKEVGISFTAGQKATLQEMIKVGDIAKYQAIVLQTLTDHVGGAAEAYAKTLAGSISIARAEASEFREGIASEVIPALEDSLATIITQAGGWKTLHLVIQDISHSIGNFVREMVYGITLSYHEWTANQEIAVANQKDTIRGFIVFLLDAAIKIADIASKIPLIDHNQVAKAQTELRLWKVNVQAYLGESAKAARDSAKTHIDAISKIEASMKKHRQALEGDSEVQKKHADAADDVAEKENQKALAAAEKSIEALELQAKQKRDLANAAKVGTDALYREEIEQKKVNTIIQIGSGLIAAHLSLKKEQIDRINKAVESIALEEARLKAWSEASKNMIELQSRLNTVISQQFKKETSLSVTFGTEKFKADINGIIDLLGRVLDLEKEARSETEKRAAAYLQIQAMPIAQSIKDALNRANANPLFSSAEQEWHDFAESISDSLVSASHAAEVEIAKIKEAISEGVMDIATGEEAIRRIRMQKMSDILNDTQQALGFMSQYFGGFFARLQELASGLQQALNFGQSAQNISSGMGASASSAAAIGGVASVVAIFAVVYDFVDKMMEKAKQTHYGAQASVFFENGDTSITAINAAGLKLTTAIKQVVHDIGAALGGAITDLGSIGVRVRNDGKYIAAYVGDLMIGHFESVDEAIKAAVQYAFLTGKAKLSGISKLVQQGMDQWTMPSFDEEMDFLTKLREISDLASSQAGQVTDLVNHLMDLFDVLSKVRNITPEVKQGFADIAASIVDAFQDWSDSITGREKTREEILFDKQREGALFNAKRAMYIASLQLEEIRLKGELAALQARGRLLGTGGTGIGADGRRSGGGHGAGGGSGGLVSVYFNEVAAFGSYVQARAEITNAEIQANVQFISAKAELAQTEVDLYNQTIAAIVAQIEAIEQIIANMPGAIDIPGIKLPNINTGGGGFGESREDQIKDFRQKLADILASGLPDIIREFRDLQKQITDLEAEAKRLKVPISELTKAEEELRHQYQQRLRQTANDIAGVGTDFTKRLREGLDLFRALQELGRKNSGIPNWLQNLLKGKFLENLRLELQSSIDSFRGLSNPMIDIQTQANQLTQNLEAFAAATGMSAEEIARAKAAIAEGIEFQRQSAINGVLDRLFGYLKGSAKWASESDALERRKIALEFRLYEFQLKSLGAWDALTQQIFNDAKDAANKAIGKGNESGDPQSSWIAMANAWEEAAQSQKEAADRLKNAVSSLLDYQKSLRTDSSLGLVNSRQAYDNSKSNYESLRAKALSGDVEAIEQFKEAAETYRKNLIAYSPSVGALKAAISDIDSSISQIVVNTHAMDPVVSGLQDLHVAVIRNASDISSGLNSSANDIIASNDNHNIENISTLRESREQTTNRQMETTLAVHDLNDSVRELSGIVLGWRSEDRNRSDEMKIITERTSVEIEKLNSGLSRILPNAVRTGGIN